MSCCPTCPEDFSVKNIPSEVECLVANKIANTPEIRDASGFIVLSTGDMILTSNIIKGYDSAGVVVTDANMVVGDVSVYDSPAASNLIAPGTLYQSASGTVWLSLAGNV